MAGSAGRAAALGAALLLAFGCSGGGGDSGSGQEPIGSPPPASPPPTSPPPPVSPPPPATGADSGFATVEATAHFLTQATFGPTTSNIDTLAGTSASAWFLSEAAKPVSLALPYVEQSLAQVGGVNGDNDLDFFTAQTPTHIFWINAVTAEDQLRQRMAYALSQIFVVSFDERSPLSRAPATIAHFQDVLARNAFGNYRDLLDEVTYSPAMGVYLTYVQNQRGDMETGRVPDENYARELMQLFTIGLSELELDGDVVTDGSGRPVETYTNDDVTGLARVFTGLSYQADQFFFETLDPVATYQPLAIYDEFHSDLPKTFLGETIPANTPAAESIDAALDHIFAHPNVAPFVSRQLIQRFVTSHPEPDYIERVATAFEDGFYTLPDGTMVGESRRGDLLATLAAVLFDENARSETRREQDDFGKLREPAVRFANWARAFEVQTVTPELSFPLFATDLPTALAQAPYKSPSVFNFYRPGYVAPGTETGAAGLTMPEMQLVNASTIAGYSNFMTYFVFAIAQDEETGPEAESFIPDYATERSLAADPAALVDHLDQLLTYGSMSEETKQSFIDILGSIPLTVPDDPTFDGLDFRVKMAVLMAVTSPDFIVQR